MLVQQIFVFDLKIASHKVVNQTNGAQRSWAAGELQIFMRW